MSRELTDSQKANTSSNNTRPVVVLAWEHSGVEELLSCSGDVIFDSKVHAAGGAGVSRSSDGKTATVSVHATPARALEVVSSTWRGGFCKIYAIPASPGDSGVYSLSQSILIMDGLIQSSSLQGESVRVSILHKNLDGNYSPRDILDQICNHLPAAGTQLVWEGDRLVLESRR